MDRDRTATFVPGHARIVLETQCTLPVRTTGAGAPLMETMSSTLPCVSPCVPASRPIHHTSATGGWVRAPESGSAQTRKARARYIVE